MTVTSMSADTVPSAISRSNRVMGVVENQHELESLTRALEPLGVSEVEVLGGDEGKDYLDQREHSFRGFLDSIFGDLESEMRNRYSQEAEQGRLIFTIPVTHDSQAEVVKVALTHGAKHVAHFGTLVEESFEPTGSVAQ